MNPSHPWLTPELLEQARVFMLGARGLVGRDALAAELGVTPFKAMIVINTLKASGVQFKSFKSQAARDATQPTAHASGQPKPKPRKARETPRKDAPLDAEPPGGVSERVAWEERGDEATVSSGYNSRITTVDQLVAMAGIDELEWERLEPFIKTWEMGSVPRAIGNDTDGWSRESSTPVVTTLFSVGCRFRRRVEAKTMLQLKADTLEAIARHAISYPRRGPVLPRKDPHLMVIGIPDLHIGKLAWATETGEGWNMEMAVAAFLDGLEGLLEQSAGKNVERIVFPVGNDLIHVESSRNMTTRGTPQDVAHRYRKVFNVAQEAMVRGIDRLSDIAPVTVLAVPGNHARESEITLVENLKAWYRLNPEVTVDASPTTRKYVSYNRILLGLTHGDEERHSDLPLIMSLDCKDSWSAARHREWLLGHTHRKREAHYLPLHESLGVRVRTMPALTAADAWHAMKGYMGSIRAAEAYLYHGERGLMATLSEPYRGE